MYYRRALKLQAFLDMADESGKFITTSDQEWWSCVRHGIPNAFSPQMQPSVYWSIYLLEVNYVGFWPVLLWAEILKGYKAVTIPSEEDKKSQRSLYAQLEAVADMKFTYVATCQNYGNQKRSGDRRATDILNLMVKYVLHLVKLIVLCSTISLKILVLHSVFSRIWLPILFIQ